jgi:hypothetical protein
MMEVELARHDWDSLRTFAGNGSGLPNAIRALVRAQSRDEAEHAYRRLDNVIQGRLSQSSSAVASCLVHGLFVATDVGRDFILDLLAEISGGYDDHVDEELVGPVSRQDCMREIARGFPLYCEVLEAGGNPSSIDLILMCGHADPQLRGRAAYVLGAALTNRAVAKYHQLIATSLAELKDVDGHV